MVYAWFLYENKYNIKDKVDKKFLENNDRVSRQLLCAYNCNTLQ
jgi:hypothetical protein